MTAYLKALRTAFVAVLTFALLFGPCLSISGFSGGGAAHAHGASSAGGHHEHAAGGHENHGPATGQHDQGSSSPLGCEELCEGWAIQKVQRDMAFVLLDRSGKDDAPPFLQDNGLARDVVFPPVRTGFIAHEAPLETASVYVLTSRYRL